MGNAQPAVFNRQVAMQAFATGEFIG